MFRRDYFYQSIPESKEKVQIITGSSVLRDWKQPSIIDSVFQVTTESGDVIALNIPNVYGRIILAGLLIPVIPFFGYKYAEPERQKLSLTIGLAPLKNPISISPCSIKVEGAKPYTPKSYVALIGTKRLIGDCPVVLTAPSMDVAVIEIEFVENFDYEDELLIKLADTKLKISEVRFKKNGGWLWAAYL